MFGSFLQSDKNKTITSHKTKMMTSRVVVYLCMTLMSISSSSGCLCSKDHPQQDFCDAEFVVKLIVENIDNIMEEGVDYPQEIMYTVNITKVYKRTDVYDGANKTVLIVPGTEWICKLDLQKDQEYIVTGRIFAMAGGTSSYMHTTMCDFNELYTDLSINMMSYLRTSYSQSCQCEVKKCHVSSNNPNHFCTNNISDRQCLYVVDVRNPTSAIGELSNHRYRHQYCGIENNACQWRGGRGNQGRSMATMELGN